MARKAFTLIELLIVVAIIAILAAIAVPNFLEAQTRSKVSRAKADMRTLVTGLESYYTDNNRYPYALFAAKNPTAASTYSYHYTEFVGELSTPVAYLTSSYMQDPFQPNAQTVGGSGYRLAPEYKGSYQYVSYDGYWGTVSISATYNPRKSRGYCVSTYGPDRVPHGVEWYPLDVNVPQVDAAYHMARIYDPTNGTVSLGDIGRFGGDVAVTTLGGGGQ